MRNSHLNYFEALRKEKEADELKKAVRIEELIKAKRLIKQEKEVIEPIEAVAIEVKQEVLHENELEESAQDAMELGEKQEVPTELKIKAKKKRKPYNCSVCHRSFLANFHLKRHFESVHEKKTRFSCQHCPSKFYRKDHLQRHDTHKHTFTNDDTSNQQRPFECSFEDCQKRFKSKTNLKVHQVVHSGKFSCRSFSPNHVPLLLSELRPFVCACGSAYKVKYDLRYHAKSCKISNET
jgi:uncharacterized Zn-finger protein